MAEHDVNSFAELVRSLLADTRDLVREEIALARAELREEASRIGAVGAVAGAAVLAGAIGIVLLCIAIGGAIAYLLHWPTWAGYGIVALLLLISGILLGMYGWHQFTGLRGLPRTTATVKENLEWIRTRSSAK